MGHTVALEFQTSAVTLEEIVVHLEVVEVGLDTHFDEWIQRIVCTFCTKKIRFFLGNRGPYENIDQPVPQSVPQNTIDPYSPQHKSPYMSGGGPVLD